MARKRLTSLGFNEFSFLEAKQQRVLGGVVLRKLKWFTSTLVGRWGSWGLSGLFTAVALACRMAHPASRTQARTAIAIVSACQC